MQDEQVVEWIFEEFSQVLSGRDFTWLLRRLRDLQRICARQLSLPVRDFDGAAWLTGIRRDVLLYALAELTGNGPIDGEDVEGEGEGEEGEIEGATGAPLAFNNGASNPPQYFEIQETGTPLHAAQAGSRPAEPRRQAGGGTRSMMQMRQANPTLPRRGSVDSARFTMSLKVEPSRETTTTRATPIATTARVTTTTTTQPKPAMRRLRLTLDSNWDLFLLLLWPAIAAASLHAVIATAADKHGGLQAATAGFGITVPIGFSMSIILYKKRFIAAALLALAYLGSCIFGGIAAGKYARGHGIAGDFDKAYAGKVQQQTTLELEKYYRARLFPNEEGGDSSYIVSTPDYTLDTSRHAYVDKGCIVPLYFDANAPDHTNFFLKVPITANYCTQEIIDSAWQQLDVVPTVLETCYGFLANTNNRDDDLEAIDQV
ncbi:MAG: hypothetical protein MHM6MM_006615 [Cercozoa sp. M6MM]